MKETVLYQLGGTSDFSMAFVLITKNNNAIVVDGGYPEDMPLLKEYVGGRHISAWILTHPHKDHISGLISEIKQNNAANFDIEKIYYNFPPYKIIENTDVRDYEYYKSELNECIPAFNEILPKIEHICHKTTQGEKLQIDEVKINFIYSRHEGLTDYLMNDSSLVFRVATADKTVLFLGDLGPEGGDVLFRESRHMLKSDIVQMAHHGHMNCGLEVYAAIMPEECIWCCSEKLYNEPEVPDFLADESFVKKRGWGRMYGTILTRSWMDLLGVRKHYIAATGIANRIVL